MLAGGTLVSRSARTDEGIVDSLLFGILVWERIVSTIWMESDKPFGIVMWLLR